MKIIDLLHATAALEYVRCEIKSTADDLLDADPTMMTSVCQFDIAPFRRRDCAGV